MTSFPIDQHQQDRELLRKAISGDKNAAQHLIQTLSRPAYSLAWKMLCNQGDAEDVVQEAFVRLWKNASSFSGKSKLSTYFYSIVSHLCLDKLRVDKKFINDLHEETLSNIASDFDVEFYVSLSQDVGRLQQALNRLTAKQRVAIVMSAYQEQTAEEIGRSLNMSKNSVDQLLYRAKTRLKIQLEGS
jgi:RNA polymerase sigma-70 factor (ECF subfamily)